MRHASRDWLRAGQTRATRFDERRFVRPFAPRISSINGCAAAGSRADTKCAVLAILRPIFNRDNIRNARSAGDAVGVAGGDGAQNGGNTLRNTKRGNDEFFTALDIPETLNNDENAWDAGFEEFDGYRQIWHKRGVMPMLRAVGAILLKPAGGSGEANVVTDISAY